MGRNLRKENIKRKNIFPAKYIKNKRSEIFEDIYNNNKLKIGRILSFGQITPQNKWLHDIRNEWVLLLQGKSEIMFESGTRVKMMKGDYILIPCNTKHKVLFTSKRPPCTWLTIYFK